VALVDASHRRHDLARRAVTALHGIVIDEGLLHGMQVAICRRQTLERRDLASVRPRRQRQAGSDAAAIDVYGAGTALPMVAAFLGAGESEPFAQHVEE
jgi:hypothetical protein